MNVRLTDRDLKLLCWINQFGFVTIDHIKSWLGVAKPTAYGVVRRLVFVGLLQHEFVLHGHVGVYRPTPLGATMACSDLPILKKLAPATFIHTLSIVDIALKLTRKFGGEFTTERILRYNDDCQTLTRRGHRPDGIFTLNGHQYAVEVELAKKSQERLKQIIKQYASNFDIEAVWYFCGTPEISRLIQKAAGYLPTCQILDLHALPQLAARREERESA